MPAIIGCFIILIEGDGMEIFQYDFMQRALAVGLVTAIICPLIGMFVVVRRQSLIGDGLGHIAFAGVMGGYLLGVYPKAAAAVFTMLGAAGIETVRRRHSQHTDTALAIFFYSGIALAVIFSGLARVPGNNMLGILFGSILTVTGEDLALIAGAGLIVGAVVCLLFNKLMLMALDEDAAAVAGVNVTAVSMLFSILTAMVVVVGMQVVGILLISALMVIPVASALLLGKGFRATMVWAVAFSVTAVAGGLTLAFYLDLAPGGTIVMTAVACYILTLLVFDRSLRFKMSRRECSAAGAGSRNQPGDQPGKGAADRSRGQG